MFLDSVLEQRHRMKILSSRTVNLSRTMACNLSRSRTQLFFTLFLTVSVVSFLASSSLPDVSSSAAAKFASGLFSASSYISSFSARTSINASLAPNDDDDNCTTTAAADCASSASISVVTTVERIMPRDSRNASSWPVLNDDLSSCDIFDGNWVADRDINPPYQPGSCPFVDDAFNCFKNGRPDSGFLNFRWKPHGCHLPRLDGRKMLRILRGKRLVFVGDSLNRNMWESLVCALRESLADKSRVFEVSGKREFKTQGFYSFRFQDYKCSIDFIKSPFLVQQGKTMDMRRKQRETLRLDTIEDSVSNYQNADIIIFNTGHWWTHHKTSKGRNYFQEGDHVHKKLDVKQAYTKALRTWAQWVDANIDPGQTRLFFRGYSASHFRGGQWNSGGSCEGETRPISNDTYLGAYPWMMKALESVISEMKTPVLYMNITKMTEYRKDGHPSAYRKPEKHKSPMPMMMIQDCSHWCLPGIPDSWNELLYTSLLISDQDSGSQAESV